jgi:hypothetical protein
MVSTQTLSTKVIFTLFMSVFNTNTRATEREGYVPHGGHPIGEAAHSTEDGKQTWLDYRNDPTLPVARAEPADR